MPTTWTQRTRIDSNATYDGAFAYDSMYPYDVARLGSIWDKRTPINIPLRQENNDYILDDYGYPIMAEMTEWSKRTRIDVRVGYDSAFAYDSSTPYDIAYDGSDWTARPNI